MYYYKAVVPDGIGSKTLENSDALNVNQESVTIGERPKNAVTAKAVSGKYDFVGWFSDEACTNLVTNNTAYDNLIQDDGLTLQAAPTSSGEKTYYAKYDYQRGNLTISNSDGYDDLQAYEFTVEGTDDHNSWVKITVSVIGNNSKTIQDLPAGSYKITQSGWSWRYSTPKERTVSVQKGETTEVTFKQVITNKKWLDGNGEKDNVFAKAADD
jgi:hypothetical protein